MTRAGHRFFRIRTIRPSIRCFFVKGWSLYR